MFKWDMRLDWIFIAKKIVQIIGICDNKILFVRYYLENDELYSGLWWVITKMTFKSQKKYTGCHLINDPSCSVYHSKNCGKKCKKEVYKILREKLNREELSNRIYAFHCLCSYVGHVSHYYISRRRLQVR